MKRLLCCLLAAGVFSHAAAQSCPPEWRAYTLSDDYICAVESGHNDTGMPELDFKSRLLEAAHTRLARQIQVRVEDVSRIDKYSVNGNAGVSYESSTSFSTDVDFRLVTAKSSYDPQTKEGFAIVYINKEVAGQYYRNELSMLFANIDNTRTIAREYINKGFKNRAQTELEDQLTNIAKSGEWLFWLGIFGHHDTAAEMTETRNALERTIKSDLAELQHATKIYLSCSATIFGVRDSGLQNQIKGLLSADGCSFVTSPSQVDYVIRITATARRYNTASLYGQTQYFSYVDADIAIDKQATRQRICEDRISKKGGHINGYNDAATAACKNAVKPIYELIKTTINL